MNKEEISEILQKWPGQCGEVALINQYLPPGIHTYVEVGVGG